MAFYIAEKDRRVAGNRAAGTPYKPRLQLRLQQRLQQPRAPVADQDPPPPEAVPPRAPVADQDRSDSPPSGPAPPACRFAHDSPLEGGGFEPSVPGAKEPVSFAEGELRGIERGRPTKVVSLRGTDGSIPSPSSGESVANLTSSILVGAVG
jgi:hypothetical protein